MTLPSNVYSDGELVNSANWASRILPTLEKIRGMASARKVVWASHSPTAAVDPSGFSYNFQIETTSITSSDVDTAGMNEVYEGACEVPADGIYLVSASASIRGESLAGTYASLQIWFDSIGPLYGGRASQQLKVGTDIQLQTTPTMAFLYRRSILTTRLYISQPGGSTTTGYAVTDTSTNEATGQVHALSLIRVY